MILVGFVLPQIAWNWLIGFVIFQQHTHPQIPWYSEKDRPSPTYFDGQVRATPHIEFATPFRGLIRHIMEHTAHHADPLVPHYRLASAQEKIESAYPEEIIRVKWSIPTFLELFRVCRLYDYSTHRWVDFDGSPLGEPLHGRVSELQNTMAKELPRTSNETSGSTDLSPAI